MSAPVLLNLLNEFRKINKMRGLPGILLLFPNEIQLLKNRIFGVKTSRCFNI